MNEIDSARYSLDNFQLIKKILSQTHLYQKLKNKKYLNINCFPKWEDVCVRLSIFEDVYVNRLDNIAQYWIYTANRISNNDLNLYYVKSLDRKRTIYKDLSNFDFSIKECMFVFKNKLLVSTDLTDLLFCYVRILEKNETDSITVKDYTLSLEQKEVRNLVLTFCSAGSGIFNSVIPLYNIDLFQNVIKEESEQLTQEERQFTANVVNIVLDNLMFIENNNNKIISVNKGFNKNTQSKTYLLDIEKHD